MFLTILGKRKPLFGTHGADEIQAVVVRCGHNNLVQHHVLDLTWFHPVIMKCQYNKSETSRAPVPRPSASESAPLDVPVASVKRLPNPLIRVETRKRTRAALLSVHRHDLVRRCLKF